MLTDRDAAILDFEAHTWAHRESAILERFGMSAARYQQLLNRLLDSPDAFKADPLLIGRLRRVRDERVRGRRARRFSTGNLL